MNGDDKNAEVKEGEAVAAPMETEEVQADSTEKVKFFSLPQISI